MASQSSDTATHWLVAVPNWAASGKARPNAEKTERQREDERKLTRRALDLKVGKLADLRDFKVPQLRVGTLDKLMALSDELHKVDTAMESTVKKVAKAYRELKGAEEDLSVEGMAPEQYAEGFEWNAAKYPYKAALGELVERLKDDAMSCEEELKKRTDRYSELSQGLAAIDRKENGTLLVKPVARLVGEDDVVEGEFLTTMLVVVPRQKTAEWLKSYETLEDASLPAAKAAAAAEAVVPAAAGAEAKEDGEEAAAEAEAAAQAEQDARKAARRAAVRNVVPRSSKELARDEEFVLYRVVAFRKGVDTLKNLFRERRWTVRSFQHDPEAEENEQDRKADLTAKLNRQHASLRLWLATTYSESFSAWVHLKAVRVFVESVLRFGIPVDFQAVVMTPRKGYRTKLRKSLAELYGWLMGASNSAAATEQDKSIDFGSGGEFYPYVFVPLDV